MAIEVLIRLISEGPTKQRLAGNIISVKSYPNTGWGREEGLPKYGVIRLPNVEFADFKEYHKPHERYVDADKILWKRRSKYRVDIAALPAAIRNTLLGAGFCEIEKFTDLQGAIVLNDYIKKGHTKSEL